MTHNLSFGERDEINALVRTLGVEINLIDERTRAELPLRDVDPFCHFRHYINDELPARSGPTPPNLYDIC